MIVAQVLLRPAGKPAVFLTNISAWHKEHHMC
jgi:hypothetical protein